MSSLFTKHIQVGKIILIQNGGIYLKWIPNVAHDFARSQDGDRWEESLVPTLSRRRNAASTCRYEINTMLKQPWLKR